MKPKRKIWRPGSSRKYSLHLVGGDRHQRMDVWRPVRMQRLRLVVLLIVIFVVVSTLVLEAFKVSLLSAISTDSSPISTTKEIR